MESAPSPIIIYCLVHKVFVSNNSNKHLSSFQCFFNFFNFNITFMMNPKMKFSLMFLFVIASSAMVYGDEITPFANGR